MALISYVEPVSIGELFVGIGSLIIALVMCYIIYRFYIKFCQYIDIIINRESKYEILEGSFLDKVAKKQGINLEKELVRRQMFQTRKKSFRRKIEEQIYSEAFGKEEQKKE